MGEKKQIIDINEYRKTKLDKEISECSRAIDDARQTLAELEELLDEMDEDDEDPF